MEIKTTFLPKVLFVATVEIHILTFHLPYLQYFAEQGYAVHVACSGDSPIPYCHVKHSIPFERSPIKKNNIKSLVALKAIIDKNEFSLIHCHTPVGGAIGRLAAAGARKKGTRVLYTAHGFHFFKGGSLKDWLVFYTIEKIMARFTDVLITINQEDYDTAIRKRFKAKAVKKIDGIGIDTEKFKQIYTEQDLAGIRTSLSLGSDDFVILCVGELSERKNQAYLLEIFADLYKKPDLRPHIKLVLAGSGLLADALQTKAEALDISESVLFLGYRKDIPVLLAASDMLITVSRQEGLAFNVLEAMVAGKPVIATDIRGHRELIRHNVNGFLVKQGEREVFVKLVQKLYNSVALCKALGQAGIRLSLPFSLDNVMAQMQIIYKDVLENRKHDCKIVNRM